MCGRFVRKVDLREAGRIFSAAVVECDLGASYNIAPRQPIAVIMERGRRKIVSMQWGLVPRWAKDPGIGNKLINARSETLEEKSSFRNAFKNQRCLIIADGFYEWQERGGKKRPFYIYRKDGTTFVMAGLYENWTDPSGKTVTTCTIVTAEANELMKELHHRMPVIIEPDSYDRWLNPAETDPQRLKKLLVPCNSDLLKAHEVGLMVNSAENDSEQCIVEMKRQ